MSRGRPPSRQRREAKIRKAEPRSQERIRKSTRGPEAPIVSRRDERGVPYPDDMPPGLGDKYRGCF